MIDSLNKPRDLNVLRGEISYHLRADGMQFLPVDSIFTEWKRIELERRSKIVPLNQTKAASAIIAEIRASGGDLSLKAILDAGLTRIRGQGIPGTELFSNSYLMALMLMVIYEY